ncbi:putative DNA-binding domain-containing protein [Endozoicomonas sp. SM1973]|uniref:DNA-binding domain-containing protein n=1 Tax=Spartinivicinus marinus TaxID=2994442 RepID=A0A853HSN5_9GAMM|nr:DNA-binding domain-containing protein [Spartinivicinus marinus]MCX4029956.1 DNA-binding domain-containing protein [Spartinivicinus marinus]NYZ64800.1 putative DNA-binding domain-containing protein [Spartinivicinus marinus]
MDSLLATRQHQLLAYLLGENSIISEHIVSQGNISIMTRLEIYRNAYQIRLKKTIETDHEILGLYLGDALFDEMVEGYLNNHVSHYTSLRQFADSLPHYLATTSPFIDYPIISELAAFERLLLTAFDAADIQRMTPEYLTTVPTEQWPSLHLTFHPSMQIFSAHWNTVEIWQALKACKTPPAANTTQALWIIWRNNERLTEFHSLSPEEHQLIHLALQGKPLAAMCDALLANHPAENTSQLIVDYLLSWIERGVLAYNN